MDKNEVTPTGAWRGGGACGMKRKVFYEQFEKLFSNTWIDALVSAALDVFL